MGCNGALASVCEALGSVPPFQTQGRKKPSGYAAHICSNQVLVNPTTSTTDSGDKETLKLPHDPERQAEILEKNRNIWNTHP